MHYCHLHIPVLVPFIHIHVVCGSASLKMHCVLHVQVRSLNTWDPMSVDPTTRCEVVCHLVNLLTHRREYKDVSQVSHKTMKPGAHIEVTVMFNQNL